MPEGPDAETAFEATFQALKARIQFCLDAGIMDANIDQRLAILKNAHETEQ